MRGIHGRSIRWDDPLSRGLIMFAMPSGNLGTAVSTDRNWSELVAQRTFNSTTTGTPAGHRSPWGLAMTGGASAASYVAPIRSVADSSPWTAMFFGVAYPGTVTTNYTFTIQSAAIGTSVLVGTLSGPANARFHNTSGTGANATTAKTPVNGEAYVAAIYHDGTNPAWIYNGFSASASNRQRGIGGLSIGAASNHRAELALAGFVAWDRILPQSTYKQFREDPLRLLRPRVWSIPFAPSRLPTKLKTPFKNFTQPRFEPLALT